MLVFKPLFTFFQVRCAAVRLVEHAFNDPKFKGPNPASIGNRWTYLNILLFNFQYNLMNQQIAIILSYKQSLATESAYLPSVNNKLARCCIANKNKLNENTASIWEVLGGVFTKLFFIINEWAKQIRVFDTGKPSLAEQSESSIRCSNLGQANGLINKNQTKLERPARDKRSSLFGPCLSCEEKNVLWMQPLACIMSDIFEETCLI